jgi:hypothetical protein
METKVLVMGIILSCMCRAFSEFMILGEIILEGLFFVLKEHDFAIRSIVHGREI